MVSNLSVNLISEVNWSGSGWEFDDSAVRREDVDLVAEDDFV